MAGYVLRHASSHISLMLSTLSHTQIPRVGDRIPYPPWQSTEQLVAFEQFPNVSRTISLGQL